MTENKRFILEEFGLNFIINDNGRNLTAKQSVDTLNQLYEENKQLKSQREDFKRALSGKDKEIMKLRRENNQMRRYLNDCKIE